jgi:hypothetical protein
VLGGAEHFGRSHQAERSYKAENYYETLSDLVLRASCDLLASPAFHEALAKR